MVQLTAIVITGSLEPILEDAPGLLVSFLSTGSQAQKTLCHVAHEKKQAEKLLCK